MTTARTAPRRPTLAAPWSFVLLTLVVAACGSSSGNGAALTVASTTPHPAASTLPPDTDATPDTVTPDTGTPDTGTPDTTTPDTSTVTGTRVSAGMTQLAATNVAVGIVDAYNSRDLSFIASTMAADGSWVDVHGRQIDGDRVVDFITPLLGGFDHTDVLGNGLAVADGWAFALREFRGGVPLDYNIVIGANEAGGVRVVETFRLPDPTDAPAACVAPSTGVQQLSITVDGAEQHARIYVPTSAPATVLPTVIDWHASGDNADVEANVTQYEALAEQEGFIVVHPDWSTPDYALTAKWQTRAATAEVGALAAANALIDELEAKWCADPARIYSTGYSLGSLFTARLVCGLSDRIAAAVSVDGIFHTDDCTPARAVPYLAFHGTADPVLPYDDTVKPVYPINSSFAALRPRVEFEKFAAAAGCNTTAIDTERPVGVIRHAYHGCADGTDRVFYEIVGGGHTWPGSTTSEEQYAGLELGPVTDKIDATLVGWDFMRHFHLDE